MVIDSLKQIILLTKGKFALLFYYDHELTYKVLSCSRVEEGVACILLVEEIQCGLCCYTIIPAPFLEHWHCHHIR